MIDTISTLHEKNKLLAFNILDLVPGNLFVLDVKSKKIIYSKFSGKEFLGFSTAGIKSYDTDIINQLLHPDDKIIFENFFDDINSQFADTIRKFELRFKDKFGKYFWFEINLSIYDTDNKNQPVQVIGLLQNIEEFKKAVKALDLSKSSYRKLFNTIEDAIYIQDETGAFIDVNTGAINLYGYSRDEFIGRTPEFLSADGKNDLNLIKEKLADAINGNPQNFKFWGRKKNGEVFLKDVKVYRGVYFDKNVLIAHARDITKDKQAEEKVIATIAEKNTLLREVHHRVKNNLQAMIYLIEMQIDKIEDEKVQIFLRELQEQARTMSLVYEQLYQSDYLAEVDMDGYLNNLTSNVIQAFGAGKEINFNVVTENALLDVEIAMPCGLIINELLTNSLKYAFTESATGRPMINISLKKINQEIEIIVSDNGVGLPENFDWENTESLGLKLVNFWVKYQLAGSINLNQDRGTKYIIIFKYEDKQ